jgi:hypothetical protein
MTTRALSSPITADAAHITGREAFAREHAFIAREWYSGLATDFGNELYPLIAMLAGQTSASWRDWANAQHALATAGYDHPPYQKPPQLMITSQPAPLWARANKFAPVFVPALTLSAGVFSAPLTAITCADGQAPDIDMCRDALARCQL